MAGNLIIYYSRKGENYVSGALADLAKGNTEICAEFIRDAIGGDLFELETVQEYAADYETCTEEAKAELENNVRPKLKRMLADISEYDRIFVCGPCWWGTYPCAVFTQLEALDFAGKQVFPLMTHEGSGLANAAKALRQYCPGATVGAGLAVVGSDAQAEPAKVRREIAAWLAGLGIERDSAAAEREFEKENVFGKGEPNTAFARYFSGNSYLNPLTDPAAAWLPLFNVTFEPGCRNNWHIHHASAGGGQILICTAGRGWYQEAGKAAVALSPGSVIVIPANVKHWHGAQQDSWFSHIAIEVPGENGSTEWCEAVTDEEYGKL